MIDRPADRWLAGAFFLYGLAVVVPLLLADPRPAADDPISARLGNTASASLARGVSSLYYDDGFYYLGIARNLAAGVGSTFDGSHPTNGYHPLWLFCLALMARVFPTPEGLLLASFAAQALAAALTAALVYLTARLFAGPFAAAVGALAWVRLMHTYWMPWSGMEYGVQTLAVAALLFCYLRVREEARFEPKRLLTLGLLAVLAFLARLDNLLLAAFLGAALLQRGPRRTTLLLYAGPVALAAAAYAAFNGWHFGHFLPVSGALKAAWSADLLAADPRYLEYGWLGAKLPYLLWLLSGSSRSFAAGLYLGSVGAVALVAAGRRGPLLALWPAAFFGLSQLLVYAAVYHGGYSFQPWYYAVQPLLAAVLGAWLIELASRRMHASSSAGLRRLAAVGTTLLIAAILLSTARNAGRRVERQQRYGAEPLYAAAGWVRSQVPPGAVVGAWNAGTIAYLSGRRVINLDGLVNSWTFFRSGRHDLCAYLEREGIDYLVDAIEIERPFDAFEPQLGRCTGRLERIWEGSEYPGSAPRRGALAFRWRAVTAVPAAVPLITKRPKGLLGPGSLGTRIPVLDSSFGAGAWVPVGDIDTWYLEGDSLRIEPGGSSFDIERAVALDATQLHAVEATLASRYKLRLSIAWQREGASGWVDDVAMTYDEGRGDQHRKTFTFDLRTHAEWSGPISRLRLRLIPARQDERIVVRQLRGFRQSLPPKLLAEQSRHSWRVDLGGEVRTALVVPPDLPAERELVVPEQCTLELAVGATGRLAAPMTARISALRPGNQPTPLFESRLEPVEHAAARHWQPVSIDLGAFAGPLRLRFETYADNGYDPALGFPAWASPELVPANAELSNPNIILISIDTLRADRLSVYGYRRVTSPRIDAWAGRFATVFLNTVAQAPWTLPSHGSMLTGLDALRHGVNHPFQAAPEELVTLAERLHSEGYFTAAISGGGWLHPHYGLAQGFERYRYWVGAGRGDQELESHAPIAARWLGELREPFFFFLHTYAVHDFNAPDRSTPPASEDPASPEAALVRLYDRAVTHMDERLGSVLASFESQGLRGRTILALTSDHGESLGEDGVHGHGTLRDQVLLVPLIVEAPDGLGAGKVVSEQVRSVDVVPTLLELAGLEVPSELDGVSLRGLVEGVSSVPPWASAYFLDGGVALRFRNRWKYVYDSSAWKTASREALFRLPGGESPERDNLASDHPRIEHFRRLALRLLEERLAGLSIRFENDTARPFTGSIRGELIRAGVPKSFDASGPWLKRTSDSVTEFSVPPRQQRQLLFERVGEPRLELEATSGESAGSAHLMAVDLETMSLPVSFRWAGSRWVTETSGSSQTAGASIRFEWHLRSGFESTVPFELDSDLRRQLEALGYL